MIIWMDKGTGPSAVDRAYGENSHWLEMIAFGFEVTVRTELDTSKYCTGIFGTC